MSIIYSSLLFHSILPCGHIVCFIYSLIDGHLGCFQILVIINHATMNILEQVFMWTYISISLCTYLRLKRMGYMVAAPFFNLTRNRWRFLFVHVFANTYDCPSFFYSHSREYEELISLFILIYISLIANDVEYYIMHLINICISYFVKYSIICWQNFIGLLSSSWVVTFFVCNLDTSFFQICALPPNLCLSSVVI